jgi:hypothetical protein
MTFFNDEVPGMDKAITIKITDFIGSPNCISAEDGQKVFEKIEALFKDGKSVILSFDRVKILISLFLNMAIGQLYGSFTEQEIRAKLEVQGLPGDDMELLRRVVDNAKKYYANPSHYDRAWQNEVGGNE